LPFPRLNLICENLRKKESNKENASPTADFQLSLGKNLSAILSLFIFATAQGLASFPPPSTKQNDLPG
jgi:hypothetical protein